jgi:hypothetical protein
VRTIVAALALSAIALAAPAYALEDLDDDDGGGGARGRRFGLGIILGEPSALTGKLFLDGTHALQLHLGYAFGRRDKLVLIVDYLFHINGVIPPIERAGRLTPYVGIGGRIGIHDDNDAVLGARVPLGLSFMINNVPLEVFVELAIGIGLIPKTVAIFDAGLGVRYYF